MRKQRGNRVEAAGIEPSAVLFRWALLAGFLRKDRARASLRPRPFPRCSCSVRVGRAPNRTPVALAERLAEAEAAS
jgi:hypothetical protein